MALIRHDVLTSKTAYATATLSVDFVPPADARGAIFYLDISAVAGTTPIADLSIYAVDRTSAGEYLIEAFVQKTAASEQMLAIAPGLTADATGDTRAAAYPIPASMRAKFVFDRTTGDETYTFTLSVDWVN